MKNFADHCNITARKKSERLKNEIEQHIAENFSSAKKMFGFFVIGDIAAKLENTENCFAVPVVIYRSQRLTELTFDDALDIVLMLRKFQYSNACEKLDNPVKGS